MTATRGHLSAIRQANLRSVLLSLVREPGSRAELALRVGLTKATVATLVDPLLARGLLAEDAPVAAGGRGRPARRLRFHPDGPVALGAEVNVGYLAATSLALDGQGAVTRRREVDNRARPAAEIAGDLAELVGSVAAEAAAPVLGLGVAVPGLVQGGTVLRAPNLPRLVGCPLGSRLASDLGLAAVELGNEANLAARAHLWPASIAGPDFVCVSGEVGIGAGLVMDGELYRGASGFAGEFGHMVIERNGRRCSCGGRGCVEQYAGLHALLRAARRRSLGALLRALDAGDPRALAAVTEAGGALGVALCSLLNLCDLPVVVLGGIYAALFDHVAPAVRGETDRRVLAGIGPSTLLRRSPLGDRAAAVGAAGLITYRACAQPDWLVSLAEPVR